MVCKIFFYQMSRHARLLCQQCDKVTPRCSATYLCGHATYLFSETFISQEVRSSKLH